MSAFSKFCNIKPELCLVLMIFYRDIHVTKIVVKIIDIVDVLG